MTDAQTRVLALSLAYKDAAPKARDLWREETGSDASDLFGLMVRAGRNDAPEVLWELWTDGCVSVDELREVLCSAYTGCERPCHMYPREMWLHWFVMTGFVSDSNRPAPTKPLEVWRAQVKHTIGLSWTTDEDKARWFFKREAEVFKRPVRMLHGFVEPRLVLALIDERKEHEVVLDPTAGRFWKVIERAK